MFNENFSFVSGTVEPISISADISPYTSRCSSPHQSDFPSDPRSQRSYRDTRYDTYRPRHQSITALTAQLETHGLSERRRPSYTSDYQDEPSPADFASAEQDEGYYEGPETPSTTSSADEFDPSLYDLSMSDISATSSPRPSLSLEAQAYSSHSIRRRQRQALIRLQCLAKRTPDLAMLIEECHPSSLPMPSDLTPRSGSSSVGGRIEKERRRSSAVVRKSPKMRKERR